MSDERKPYPAKLAGRCANGYERGQGSVIHAVSITDADARIQNTPIAAMCGKKHGLRSAGWSVRVGEEITCTRCARLVEEWKKANP